MRPKIPGLLFNISLVAVLSAAFIPDARAQGPSKTDQAIFAVKTEDGMGIADIDN